MISPWKLIGWAFVGLLLIGGALWFNRRKDENNAAALAVWQQKFAKDTAAHHTALDSAYQAGLQNAQSIPVYLAGKTQIIHDAASNPQAAAAVKACFEAADTRISACEKSRKADSVLLARKDSVIGDLEHKPIAQERRFQFFGAVGYAVRYDSAGTQMAPAFRAGIDSKILGPVRLTADAQLSMPGRGHSTPMTQVSVMGRVNF